MVSEWPRRRTRSIGPIAWVLVALLAATMLLAGWRGANVAMLFAVVLLVAWLTSTVLIATGYHDADGFMDCWPYCTALQEITEFALFYCPVLLVLLAAGRLAGWMTRRVKR